MLVWSKFPFIRFGAAAIIGILWFNSFPQHWASSNLTLLLVSMAFLISWILNRLFRTRFINLVLGFSALVFISYSFGTIAKNKNELNDPGHWRNVEEPVLAFLGKVNSVPLEKATTHRYTVEIERVKTKNGIIDASGQLHLYVSKSRRSYHDKYKTLAYGDVIWVYGRPSEIPPPTNPEEFNYSRYVARQQIHGQCFIKPDQLKVSKNIPKSAIMAAAYSIRNSLADQIDENLYQPETKAIAFALLIGIKDYLSEDLKRAYASAGAMHVLAVSGLHVGILYLVLAFLLRPFKKKKYGPWIIASISIFTIWMYAFVTGMSPSVLRAAVMFSIMATSTAINRDNSIFNSIGIAAFILLIYDPYLLFSVGFQLSFLAVIGIVYLQPRIYRLLYARNYIIDKIWSITAVSIAAQIATLPMTIFYFNQFPTYFFLSNLVVIPGAMLIMFMGMAMLCLGAINSLAGAIVGFFLNGIIWIMNYLVLAVERIPGSLITWLYFDHVQVILIYVFLILLLLGLKKSSSFYVNLAFMLFIGFFGWTTHKRWIQLQKEELVIYDFNSTTAIDYVKGEHATLHLGSMNEANKEMLEFQINPYRRANGLNPVDTRIKEFSQISIAENRLSVGFVGNKKVMVLDSTLQGLKINEPLFTDILVINNQSVKSTKWLNDHFQYNHLVIGSDNSMYYSGWLQKELRKQGIRAHSLLLDGSWIE